MFTEAIAASDWETVSDDGYEFTFSCRKRSIICMEVRKNGRAIWDNPGPMMPGQWPTMLKQPALDTLNRKLSKRYRTKIEWRIKLRKHRRDVD